MKNLDVIKKKFKNDAIIDESLSKHSTIKIGGVCSVFVYVKSTKKLIWLLKFLKKNDCKFVVIGNGSNLLFGDGRFDGVVIKLVGNFLKINMEKKHICAGAGISLFAINRFCADNCIGGLEWSFGIPGTLGGAIVMNAGAYGHEICHNVSKVCCVTFSGKKKTFKNKNCKFSYRNSIFQNAPFIILKVVLCVYKEKRDIILSRQQKYLYKRRSTQPTMPSLGSVFKRSSNSAPIASLIEKCGLKGHRVGDAEISKKHSGFIVNCGHATCQEVLFLIEYIQTRLKSSFNVLPDLEIIVKKD